MGIRQAVSEMRDRLDTAGATDTCSGAILIEVKAAASRATNTTVGSNRGRLERERVGMLEERMLYGKKQKEW
jgi:hypothetical protein